VGRIQVSQIAGPELLQVGQQYKTREILHSFRRFKNIPINLATAHFS